MNRLAGLVFLALAAAPAARAMAFSDIEGTWARQDGETRIKIAPCGADICATNIWIAPSDTEEKVGDVLVMTLKPTRDGALAGEAFDRRRNMHYSIDITLKGADMTSEGCILMGLLCRSRSWTRLGD